MFFYQVSNLSKEMASLKVSEKVDQSIIFISLMKTYFEACFLISKNGGHRWPTQKKVRLDRLGLGKSDKVKSKESDIVKFKI